MNKHAFRNVAAVACAVALAGLLAGCAAGASTTATEEQQANRAYMSQVNEAMTELDGELAQFVDAVSRGDVVNMRSQAENAYKVLDDLSELEAPEALADVHKEYVEGTAKLREALNGYVDLYTEIAAKDKSFNWSTYEKRMADIQKLYDEGIELLEKADASVVGSSSDAESGPSASSATAESDGSGDAGAESGEAASAESESADSADASSSAAA